MGAYLRPTIIYEKQFFFKVLFNFILNHRCNFDMWFDGACMVLEYSDIFSRFVCPSFNK